MLNLRINRNKMAEMKTEPVSVFDISMGDCEMKSVQDSKHFQRRVSKNLIVIGDDLQRLYEERNKVNEGTSRLYTSIKEVVDLITHGLLLINRYRNHLV